MKIKPLLFFLYSYLALYFILLFINLSYIPVAWIDEILFLDPAVQFLKTGRYTSRIWWQEGTETFFFAYLPLIEWIHILNLSLFPWEIFFVRLPFIIIFGVALYYFYLLLNIHFQLDKTLVLFILFLFINDRAVSESVRSVRTESIEVMLIALVFWRTFSKKNDFITTFFLSLLSLTHLKVLPVVVIVGLYLFLRQKEIFKKVVIVIVFFMPVLLFLAWSGFNLQLLIAQLLPHAQEHTTTAAGTSNIFFNHFAVRFWPYYTFQPYVPLLFYSTLILAIYRVATLRSIDRCLFEICFLALNIFWFFTLGAFPRYNPVILIFTYGILGSYFNSSIFLPYLNKKVFLLMFALSVPVICFPFLTRQGAALLQREERDVEGIIKWYDKHFTQAEGKKLVIGEPSAYYYFLKKDGITYCSDYSLEKFRFEDYHYIYFISAYERHHVDLERVDQYLPKRRPLVKEMGKGALTYYGTILYKVKSKEALAFLKTIHND